MSSYPAWTPNFYFSDLFCTDSKQYILKIMHHKIMAHLVDGEGEQKGGDDGFAVWAGLIGG